MVRVIKKKKLKPIQVLGARQTGSYKLCETGKTRCFVCGDLLAI